MYDSTNYDRARDRELNDYLNSLDVEYTCSYCDEPIDNEDDYCPKCEAENDAFERSRESDF